MCVLSDCMVRIETGSRGEARILRLGGGVGLEPRSSLAQECEPILGSGAKPPNGGPGGTAPVGVRVQRPPAEAESSVAFEDPAEEPNLTLLPAL